MAYLAAVREPLAAAGRMGAGRHGRTARLAPAGTDHEAAAETAANGGRTMEDIIKCLPCCIILLIGGIIVVWRALIASGRADEGTGSLEGQKPKEWRE